MQPPTVVEQMLLSLHMAILACQPVWLDYTNWKGRRAWRRVLPYAISFATTEYHPAPQWLLTADDLDEAAPRTFALRDVHAWRSTPPEEEET
jgi:predicted DNA-binding transcriptional regulator YafY